MQHLVTVTCRRDRAQMLIQAESLRYLTEPITHHVIVDSDSDIDTWYQLLSPFYTSHTLDLSPAPDIISNSSTNTINCWHSNGWRRQQIYKLLAWQRVQADYLIIDSQNFFIRPCTLDLWSGIIGTGFWNDSVADCTVPVVMTYSRHLSVAICRRVRSDGVPFVINASVMTQYDVDTIVDQFQKQQCAPMEFVFYNLMAERLGLQGRQHDYSLQCLVRQPKQQFPADYWQSPNCVLAGIHRTFLNYGHNRSRANTWLQAWGFNGQL